MRVIFFKRILNIFAITLVSFSLIFSPFSVEAKSPKHTSRVSQPQKHKAKRTSKASARSRVSTKGKRVAAPRNRRGRGLARGSSRAKRGSSQRRQVGTRSRNVRLQAPILSPQPQVTLQPQAEIQRQHSESVRLAHEEACRKQEAQRQEADAQRAEALRMNQAQARQDEAQRQACAEAQQACAEAQRQAWAEVQRQAEERTRQAEERTRQAEARRQTRIRLEETNRQALARREEAQRQAQARQEEAQRQEADAQRAEALRMNQAQAHREEAQRQAEEGARQAEAQRHARTNSERARNAADMLIPLVAEGQPGLTINTLLEELIRNVTKVHNTVVFHWLRTQPKETIQAIVLAVDQKRTDGQITHKQTAKLALIEETVKARLRILQRANVSVLEREDCLTQAFTLIMQGKVQTYQDAVDHVQSLLSIKKEFGKANLPVDWEEAKNILLFTHNSGIQDIKIAKFYYDFARKYSEMNIGHSAEKYREYLARILKDQITYEEDRLSMKQTPRGDFLKREEYAKKHLRAAFTYPSIEKYFEDIERENFKQRYQEEINRRAINANIIDNRRLGDWYAADTRGLLQASFDLMDQSSRGQAGFNFIYNYQDPHLVYLLEADNKLPQVPVTPQNIVDIYGDLIASLRAYAPHPTIEVPNLDECINYINAARSKICVGTAQAVSMRARMVRAFKTATEGEGVVGQDPNVLKARFALSIAQNEGRCIDGINEWLTEFEMENIYKTPKNMGFAVMVSALLAKEKLEFIAAHKPNTQTELATGGPALLRQRMRIGFGLPIPYCNVTHPGLAGTGAPTADIYNPVLALNRFFRGGELTFDNGVDTINFVQFQPFTVDRFINLVRTAWLEKRITDNMLIDEIQKDLVLKNSLNDVFSGDEWAEDQYYRNVESREEKYKKPLFKRLLCRAGFLIDDREPAFD